MARVVYRDLGLKKILKEVENAGLIKLRVGVVGSKASEPAGIDGRLTNAENALIQYYGTDDGKIPPRKFLTEPLENNKAKVQKLLRDAGAKISRGERAETAIDEVGRKVVVMITDGILDAPGIRPLNAPATVDKKGFQHPLVDTSTLVDAISHRLVREGGDVLEGGSAIGDYEAFEVSGGGPAE